MKLTKKSLLYDIANMAYLIADTGEHDRHTLHRVRDICQDGNIDRVSRVLGLAYSRLLAVMIPVLRVPEISLRHDFSATPHDYEFAFREDRNMKYALTTEKKLRIKELCREYMVCMVLADWLAVTMPEAADVWKERMEKAFENITALVLSVSTSLAGGYRRKLNPF